MAQQETVNDNTPYDDVFRTLLEKCTRLIIPVINEVFKTSYSIDEPVRLLANEHFVPDGKKSQKRITDSCVLIQNRCYHLECESKSSKAIVIRMIEYDFHIALQNRQEEMGEYFLNFPDAAVLFLRDASGIPGNMVVNIAFPDGQQIKYILPAVKVQEYTKEELFDKKLLFFLPYYIMRFEKKIDNINRDDKKLRELSMDYEDVYRRLYVMEKSNIIDYNYLYNLAALTNRLIGIIAKNADNVRREVMHMGGRVLELGSEKILQQGLRQGIEQGMKQGIQQGIEQGIEQGMKQGMKQGMQQGISMMITNMYENNMTPTEIASIARLSVPEVEKILESRQL